MSNLYSNLAAVYEAMYKTFIDYEAEYGLYSQLLLKYGCKSVVEIGCGTGNLATRLMETGFDYTGLDISEDMIGIAKKNNTGCNFIRSGMQDFVLPLSMDAAIITGRTISYLLTNKEVSNSLAAIHKNINVAGIVCFDFIDANQFIPLIGNNPVVHKADTGHKVFRRESYWTINYDQSWAFDWLSVFYEVGVDGKLEKIGEDNSTIRAFTKDEIILFLELAGFKINEMIPRKTYAFDTFVVVAEKK